MRKLSNTFLLVGMIMALVCLGLFVITSVGFFVLGSPLTHDVWREAYQQAVNSGASTNMSEEVFVQFMSGMFIGFGVVFIIIAAFCIPATVTSAKARKSHQNGSYIAAIILNALCGSGFSIAGAILGLIANKREERNARNNKVVDAQ